jgi:hypothetical protein
MPVPLISPEGQTGNTLLIGCMFDKRTQKRWSENGFRSCLQCDLGVMIELPATVIGTISVADCVILDICYVVDRYRDAAGREHDTAGSTHNWYPYMHYFR